MLNRFEEILKNRFNNFEDKNIFLAISGGKDSMALCHLLIQLDFRPVLLHCNFQLRNEESDLDESFLISYANANHLQIQTKKIETESKAKELRLTIQETARNLRYNWFNTFLKADSDILLTAHHLDDSIETFFINLMRGTGLQGLTGITEVQQQIIRPLSSFTASEIQDYVSDENIKFRQDQSNFDDKYLRNYVRNVLIPEFNERSDNFNRKVEKTLKSLNQVNSWIKKQAEIFKKSSFIFAENYIQIDKQILINQDTIFLEYIFRDRGIHRSNVKSFYSFLKSNTGGKFFTNNSLFWIDRNNILIQDINEYNTLEVSPILIDTFPAVRQIMNVTLTFNRAKKAEPFGNENFQQFDYDKVQLPLKVRKWKHGDKLSPLGMSGTKLISDILIDKKISDIKKDEILVIEDKNQNILSIPGLLISNTAKLSNKTKSIVTLTLTS